jgi:hypothetical protein
MWLIPAVLAAAVYLPSLGAGFVWDDDLVLKSQLTYFQSPKDAFFPPEGIPEFGIAYYRPLVSLSYMLDFGVYGRDATVGPHLTNVLIHVLATIFVFFMVRRILGNAFVAAWSATLGATIFAMHPIHVESVSWISGRSDPLAAALMLPAILLAFRYRASGSVASLVCAPLLYLLALLSKEVAAATLVLIPLLFMLVPRSAVDSSGTEERIKRRSCVPPSSRRLWISLGGGFLLATVLYVVLRQSNDVGSGASLMLPVSEWPARLLRSTAYYLLKIVVPPPQSHVVPIEHVPGLAVSIVLMLVGVGMIAAAAVEWNRRGRASLLVSLLWFGLTLAPSMIVALGRISETPVAERYLYVPSVALALAVGGVLVIVGSSRRGRAVSIPIAGAVVILYGGMTLHRGRSWTSDLRLWTDAAAKIPDNGLIWLNLGQAHFETGDRDRAMECYEKALEAPYHASGRAKAHNNRGAILRAQGRLDEAEAAFRAAIAEDPDYATAHYGLGMVFVTRAENTISRPGGLTSARTHAATAIEHLTAALRFNPRLPDAMWGLAWARINKAAAAGLAGDLAEADRQFDTASAQLDALESIQPGYEKNGLTIGQARERLRSIRSRLPR